MSKAFFKSMNVTEVYVPFSIFKYQSFVHSNRHVNTECSSLKTVVNTKDDSTQENYNTGRKQASQIT